MTLITLIATDFAQFSAISEIGNCDEE